MAGHIQSRRYIFLQIKCPSLLADRNQKFTHCATCAMIYSCGAAEKLLEWQGRYIEEGNLFCKYSALHYWPIATKHSLIVQHAP